MTSSLGGLLHTVASGPKPLIAAVHECRNAETLTELIQGAQSGHEIWSTLVASSGDGVVYRLASVFPISERAARFKELVQVSRVWVHQELQGWSMEGQRGWDVTWRWLVLDENVRATLLQTTWNASGVIEVVPPLPWNEVTVRRPALFED